MVKLGLRTPQDFILHLPLRYEDETQVTPVARLVPGRWAQIEGEVVRCEVQSRPRRQLVATVADDTGEIGLRFLTFYPSHQRQLATGNRVRVRGEPRGGLFGLEMVHPRLGSANVALPDTLTPVYPITQGLSQSVLRRAVVQAMGDVPWQDTLPHEVRERFALEEFDEAIRALHYPTRASLPSLQSREHAAWRRVKFDELLAQQLSLAVARAARRRRSAPVMPAHTGQDCLAARLQASLPFALSGAQRRVVGEIAGDMARPYPMQRLLQGDVGSGKTVVAALAAAQAVDNGYQAALMAPTELLAEQHLRKFTGWFEPLGIRIAWLSGSVGAKARREALAAIASGEAALAVGTQALIQEHVHFHRLGLALTDEQHRFGVGQRLALRQKGAEAAQGGGVHQLMMSATPIPRTLAMTVFADLDVSEIDELPPGRTPIVTKLVDDVRRDEVIERIHAAVADGRQAYWVCPLVEESEALELQTAVDTFERLRVALPGVRVGLVHGKLAPADKAQVMRGFQEGSVDLLVATTVIEVGVDVPNASLMVVEHAERFGLAQLHQLRGRVGRGTAESVCVLMYQTPLSRVAKARLRTLHESTDGFLIAERDLELRGPGEFLGVRQSGEALLRFADLQDDAGLAEEARQAAAWMLQSHRPAVREHLARWLRGREDFLKA